MLLQLYPTLEPDLLRGMRNGAFRLFPAKWSLRQTQDDSLGLDAGWGKLVLSGNQPVTSDRLRVPY